MRVISDRLIDDLHGNDTVQHGVPGTVNHTEGTTANPVEDFVSAYTLKHDYRGL